MKTKSYKNTNINWTRSQGLILKLLESREIQEIRFTQLSWETIHTAGVTMEKDTYALMIEFLKLVPSGKIPIRIFVPNLVNNNEKLRNQAYRVLFWYLKTKFEAIDTGLVEFEQEFMPHISLGKGNGLMNVFYAFKQKILPSIASGQKADIQFLTERT